MSVQQELHLRLNGREFDDYQSLQEALGEAYNAISHRLPVGYHIMELEVWANQCEWIVKTTDKEGKVRWSFSIPQRIEQTALPNLGIPPQKYDYYEWSQAASSGRY